jgi:hypothetical protein
MITLTKSETRPPSKKVRITGFELNAPDRSARIIYHVGFVDASGFHRTREIRVMVNDYDPEANFTFTQLLAAVPEVRTLGEALEEVALNVGIFDGVVD